MGLYYKKTYSLLIVYFLLAQPDAQPSMYRRLCAATIEGCGDTTGEERVFQRY
jgi:hypothetical protein